MITNLIYWQNIEKKIVLTITLKNHVANQRKNYQVILTFTDF
jgi:hypothetical protein